MVKSNGSVCFRPDLRGKSQSQVKSSQSRDFDFVLKKKVQVITQRYRTFKLITVQYVLLKNGTVL